MRNKIFVIEIGFIIYQHILHDDLLHDFELIFSALFPLRSNSERCVLNVSISFSTVESRSPRSLFLMCKNKKR